MIEIKVLGTGCPNCNRLEQLCRDVVSRKGIEARIEKITDFRKFADYGVLFTPGLVINGVVKSSGKIPSRNTLEHWLSEADGKVK